ncbi:MAG: prolyl oligopeptidase family serine peptidase [Spirochaetes bacterium]|nr:prolyl oligopeptidase family serine peptidase [Spirochaetota bacterium]
MFQGPAVTIVEEGTVNYDGCDWTYKLLELHYPGAKASYAMWIPPKDVGVKPAVLMTNPYDGITWNGDEPPPSVTVFSLEHYIDSANIFLLQGFGVLHVFERFYTGDNLRNDVTDTVAGLRFLRSNDMVDASRIGIWGASWGGFESLYGAANAPAGAVPAAGVAFYPPIDFATWTDYVTGDDPGDIPQMTDTDKRDYYTAFFQTYVDRVYATSGWDTWTANALLAKLETPFLLVHDEWDVLVPVGQSQSLVNSSSGMVRPVWFYQNTPIDIDFLPITWGHGELRQTQMDSNPPDGFTYGMLYTLSTAFIINRLADPAQIILLGYDEGAVNDFITYLRDYKCNHGKDVSWAEERLLDVVDSRVFLVEMNTLDTLTGAAAVADAFGDAGWGSASYHSGATIADALASGLPVCP